MQTYESYQWVSPFQVLHSAAASSSMAEPLGRDVLERLLTHPSLRDNLTWTHVQRFLRFSQRIWPEILGTSTSPPLLLPGNIQSFLGSVLDLEQNLVQLCWTAFNDLVPSLDDGLGKSTHDDDMFRIHGHEFLVGMHACHWFIGALYRFIWYTFQVRNPFNLQWKPVLEKDVIMLTWAKPVKSSHDYTRFAVAFFRSIVCQPIVAVSFG